MEMNISCISVPQQYHWLSSNKHSCIQCDLGCQETHFKCRFYMKDMQLGHTVKQVVDAVKLL